MKTIKGQLLMSTLEDSQGERRDKRFLEEILERMPPRYPLGQHHDSSLRNIGFIENFRIEELQEHPGDWCIRGDITIEEDLDWTKGGGFSFSTTEIIKRQENGMGALYVPYPYYRDEALLNEVLSYDPRLHVGKWIKKAAEPGGIALMACLSFFLAPVWETVWNEKVWPFLKRALEQYRKGRLKDMPLDFGFTAQSPAGTTVNILFIPERTNVHKTFTKELVEAGLRKAMKLVEERPKGAVQVTLIKLYYHDAKEGYRVLSVQYSDGRAVHEI